MWSVLDRQQAREGGPCIFRPIEGLREGGGGLDKQMSYVRSTSYVVPAIFHFG